MKKIFIILTVLTFFAIGCSEESLIKINPNDPSFNNLTSEGGVTSLALGIYEKGFGANNSVAGGTSAFFVAFNNHFMLGDETFTPYGNWGFRWVGQVYDITLPNSKVVVNPIGTTQKVALQGFNSREAGERNAFLYEWYACYATLGQANLLLEVLENPELQLSGDAAAKKSILQTWAYWWKGYCYSRLGSMYLSGVIVDKFGETNDDFVDRNALIIEANENFDLAIGKLTTLTADATYTKMLESIVPAFSNNKAVVSPTSWSRIINTYKARNLLVNKKVNEMTSADWNQVIALTTNGLQSSDRIFTMGMSANNDYAQQFFHPFIVSQDAVGWVFVSERIIQEYKTGDNRLNRDYVLLDDPYVNILGRGYQFGTRYRTRDIEEEDGNGDNGSFSTTNFQGQWVITPTYEENALMRAEALLYTGDIEGALQIVDEIRDYQNANLAPVEGTGLTLAQAEEELRRERRVALTRRGVGFYDARRWGRLLPVSQGGGRTNAIVLLPAAEIGQSAADVRPCTMNYDYLEYWDVPKNELDFNTPGTTVPIKN